MSLRQQKLPPGTPDDIEAEFYESLQQGDVERLIACWAEEDEISCVYPGGPRLLGIKAIREAFEKLLARGPVRVIPERIHRLVSDRMAVHSVVERVEIPGDDGVASAWVLATNVYAPTDRGWRMVSHHASPGSQKEPVDVQGATPLLH